LNYRIVTLAQRWDLFQAQDSICSEAWPEFMLHDPVAHRYWMRFMELFTECQLMLMLGDEILAVVNAVPLSFKESLDLLPDEGWDWGVEKSVRDRENGAEPNILMGVQIVVNREHQGKGLSSSAVEEMKRLASRMGLERLILPARPSEKSRHPLIPIEEYITWKNEDGLPFDSWLRVHVRSGGEIIGVCSRAMQIPGSIAQWREWTGMEFPGSGPYIVPGALNPVSMDLESDRGLYVEPNVWIIHDRLVE
jgi:GNAT superfamily N-acetyltransferase